VPELKEEDMPFLPLATLMVYLLRLSQEIKNITTAMVSFILSIKKENRYGE
jgi:hypothetical protein